MIRLYNTKTRKLEEFVTLEDSKVGIYSCGPTVYSSPHIGNLRAYVFVDILRKTLEINGYKVMNVMNITDVGHLFEEGEEPRLGQDKLEYEANKERISVWEIAKKYTAEFLADLDALNIEQPTLVRATDNIQEMIQLIKTLEEKGFTYKTNYGIYFDTSQFSNYGQLAGGKDGIQPGVRVEMVEGKKNPTDFALWKFEPAKIDLPMRQMNWWFEGPFAGQLVKRENWSRVPTEFRQTYGFPGWHIECSAMAMKYLGDAFENGNFRGEQSRTIDIHTGGIDHIPIHHTNEIAQSEAATGKEFVKFWLHNEFVLVDGQKMSKSLGNVYTLADIKQRGFDPLALRYLFLTAHYRDKLNFTWDSLQAAQNALNNLRVTVRDVKSSGSGMMDKFMEALNNDLGVPQAMAVFWEAVKKGNGEDILKMDKILGLGLEKYLGKSLELPVEITELVEKREVLRKEGKWKESDKIRQALEQMGYAVEDKQDGYKIKKSWLRKARVKLKKKTAI